ncbi:MAG: nitrous oxide reductase accessory protein NosL [Prevotella sp.]|nr:nitrous oxide reductase accessory protein NosL [Prevotella sp.]
MMGLRNLLKPSAPAWVSALMALALCSCSVDDRPQSVNLGKDKCTACSMTIEDAKFACEYITDKGKCFKFDDATCLFHYLDNNQIADSTLLKVYIADYEQPDSLIDIKTASLVLGEDIHSPMNGGIAAFKNRSHAIEFAQQTRSILLDSWERLKINHQTR